MSSKMSQSMLKDVIARLSSKYNFDATEAYEMIGAIKSVSKVKNVVVKNVVVKSAFPLPYSGELNVKCCLGMRQNNGLYTQCEKLRPEDKGYCSICESQAMKNEHGLPDYGNIEQRLSAYQRNEEFKDPSGKSPVAYTKIMNKFKVTKEQVVEEGGKLGLLIDPRHFEEVAKKCGRPKESKKEKVVSTEVKSKGRPKKSKKVLELAGEEDLFASLVMSANSQVIVREVVSEVVGELVKEVEVEVLEKEIEVEVVSEVVVKAKPTKKSKVSTDENKEAKEQEKLAKELAKEQEKADKEKEKALKLIIAEQQKFEKMLQAAQKKQELEEQKAAKLILAEQKKSELAEQKKEKKVATKVTSVAVVKEVTSVATKEVTSVATKEVATKEVVEEEADVVKKIMFEGKKYLKSKNTGIIYNMDQDVIGKWNEEKQRIDFNEQDEESEDEYDEDE
jgi:hypothetical protein